MVFGARLILIYLRLIIVTNLAGLIGSQLNFFIDVSQTGRMNLLFVVEITIVLRIYNLYLVIVGL